MHVVNLTSPKNGLKEEPSVVVVATDRQSDLKTENRNDKKTVTEQTILDVTNSDSLKITIVTPESKISLHNDKLGEVTKSNEKPISNKEKPKSDNAFTKEIEMKNSINKEDFEGVKMKQGQLKQIDRSPKPPILPSVAQVRK